MEIDFYFDPSCPFCWVTSRWLLMVSNQRDIKINWCLFSLAIKNQEVGELAPQTSNFNHLPAHRVERVMLTASKEGKSLQELYTTFGIKHFLAGDEYDDETIIAVLSQLKLDSGLIKSADNEELDEELRQSTNKAVGIVGADIGVPTIIFNKKDGTKTGFFGPVIQQLPEMEEAIDLWDGLVKLVGSANFYEIKRGRPEGGPDVVSTAKC
jgi:predicted DsbA family dithiol-disulfide isomerase